MSPAGRYQQHADGRQNFDASSSVNGNVQTSPSNRRREESYQRISMLNESTQKVQKAARRASRAREDREDSQARKFRESQYV